MYEDTRKPLQQIADIVMIAIIATGVVAWAWTVFAPPGDVATPVYDYTCEDGAYVAEARCGDV